MELVLFSISSVFRIADENVSRPTITNKDPNLFIVSFVLNDREMGVKRLILLRTLFFEEVFDEEERGVKVSMEGDDFEQEDFNVLSYFKIEGEEIEIKTPFREYKLDISRIEKSEIEEMLNLLKKQNYDNRFTIQIA